MLKTKGLHHVTAIAGDPQENLDFYIEVLGLRLVKRTVNFDDPKTYHFYFGDGIGTPGTILTFFPWPGGRQGQKGNGQAVATGFAVPVDSLEYWIDRLTSFQVRFEDLVSRFDERYLSLSDPDGLKIELVGTDLPTSSTCWQASPVEAKHAIYGLHNVTLLEEDVDATSHLLIDHLGYTLIAQEKDLYRFSTKEAAFGTLIDIRRTPGAGHGKSGVGTIHHIAFRAENDDQQLALRDELMNFGLNATAQLDRNYFRSIYFREPGGILFEVATDDPGFAVDESLERLGSDLKLPEKYETDRDQIEAELPKITVRR